jgi:hypothetical protein
MKATLRVLVAVSLAITVAIGAANDFELFWWTVDGGGEMWTTGGDFELSGTSGQPDANITVMTGGGFELTGGFWPGVSTPKVASPGDPGDHQEPEDVRPAPPP